MIKKFFQKKRVKLLIILLTSFFFLFNGVFYSFNLNIPNIIKTSEASAQFAPPAPGTFGRPIDPVVQHAEKNIADPAACESISWWHPFQKSLVWFLSWVLYMILKLVSVFLALAGLVLDAAMNFDRFLSVPEVKSGWIVTRDLCNMFFILILLTIGFATIFRIEGYGAKRLLVKLIIAAILINFSFLISGLIIDSSQVIMKTFRSSIGGSFSAAAASVAGIQNQYGNKDSAPTYDDAFKCLSWDAIGSIIKTIAFGIILFFVILAIAIILVIRLIALWILVILSPFAYLLSILPKTQDLASRWWSTFLKYCFIGPVMMFFMMLALKLGEGANQFTASYIQGQASNATSFIGLTLESFLRFLMMILLLIAGASSAVWLSIAGAGKVVGGVQGFAKGTGKLAGRGVLRGGAAGGVGALALAGGGAERLGLTKAAAFLRRPAERREIGKQLAKKAVVDKKQKDMMALAGDSQLDDFELHGSSKERIAATQEKLKRGNYRNASAQDAQRAAQTLGKFGYREDVSKLYEQRPDIAPDMPQSVRESVRTGEHKKLSAEVLNNPKVVKELESQLGSGGMKKYYNDLDESRKQVIRNQYLKSTDVKDRDTYAKLTGDIKGAYAGMTGDTNKMAADYVSSMKPEDASSAKTAQDLEIVGQHSNEAQLEGFVKSGKFSQEQLKSLKKGALSSGQTFQGKANYVNNSPAWQMVT